MEVFHYLFRLVSFKITAVVCLQGVHLNEARKVCNCNSMWENYFFKWLIVNVYCYRHNMGGAIIDWITMVGMSRQAFGILSFCNGFRRAHCKMWVLRRVLFGCVIPVLQRNFFKVILSSLNYRYSSMFWHLFFSFLLSVCLFYSNVWWKVPI